MFEVQHDDERSTVYHYYAYADKMVAEHIDIWGNTEDTFEISTIKVCKSIWEATGRIFNTKTVKTKFFSPDVHVVINSTGLHMSRNDRPIRITRWEE